MSIFDEFIDEVARALGKDDVHNAVAQARADDIEIEGDPENEIQEQAAKLAAAIKEYLIALAGDTANVRKPNDGEPPAPYGM